MIIETGLFALEMALLVSLTHVAMGLIYCVRRSHAKLRTDRFFATIVFLLILLSFAALWQAYLRDDFSVANVAHNSHSALPLPYKMTAIWGNHEGSMLLFTLLLALFTWLLSLFPCPNRRIFSLTLACQQAIISAFLAFILLTSSPLVRLEPAPSQGADLNPLLQDIGLILHPPLLYLGLVGFSIAFSFAIAALITRHCTAELGAWMRPWLLFSWSFLTLGITFGSYWAYYELGWGGYWFWDPVENASLMPWLSACALIHCSRVLAKRSALKLWTLLLAILTFSLALLGTFLVRADLLISVHNFAAIPERSLALLAIVVFFSGGALLLFALRAPQIEMTASFEPLSREGALIINTIFLGSACATVLIGTLYPMILEALSGERLSVGPPFFNMMFALSMIPLMILMPFGPLLGWKRADIITAFERLGLAFAASLAVMITTAFFHEGRTTLSSLAQAAMLGLATWLIIGALSDLLASIALTRRPLRITLRRLVQLPPAHYGRCLAHGGVGISLAGIVAVNAFSHEVIDRVSVGQSFNLNETIVRFERIIPQLEKLEFSLSESGQNKNPFGFVYPSRRFFPARTMETSEVSLLRHGLSHYYIAAGNANESGAIVVHAWYKAYVLAIWLGGFFMAAGGFLALIDKGKHRERRKK